MPDDTPAASRWAALSLWSLAALAVVAGLTPWMNYIVKTGNPCEWGAMPLVAMTGFIALCGANAWAERRGRPPLVTPAETAAVFLILVTGSWVATWAYVSNMMPLLTSPFVFASPDNGWTERILPHLPRWAMGPAEEPYASAFYNGLATGAAIPWGRWLVPVVAWSLFAGVLTLFSVGLAGIVSRQWIEHDRLTFPQVEVLLSAANGVMRERLFWWGVAAASAVPVFNLIHKFLPLFPAATLYFGGDKNGVELIAGAGKIQTELKMGALGLLYFVHRDIILSMCVLFFVVSLKDKGLALLGYKLEHADLYAGGGGIRELQIQGALLALVLAGLWSARSTLRAYVKSALDGEDRDWSWLSPRATLAAFAAGCAGIVGWLVVLGLRQPGGLAAFLVSHTLGWIGLGRVAAESALEVQYPVEPFDMTTMLAGTRSLVPAGLVTLAVAMSWAYGSASFTQLTNTLQGEKLRAAAPFPRWLVGVVLAAPVIATAASMLGTLFIAYRHGANNFGVWEYQWQMRIPYDLATEAAKAPHGVDWPRIGWLGIGGAQMLLLILLRNHIVGWFLHPLGLILCSLGLADGGAHQFVFTGFVVWGVKTLFLRLGGVETYERYKSLFAGFVIGGFFPAALTFVVNIAYFLVKGRPLA